MKIEEKKIFNVYKKKFLSSEYDLNTIVCLIDDIRHSIRKLNYREFRKLIEIPISVAKQDIDYKDSKLWVEEYEPSHREYFRGNIYPLKEYEFFNQIYKKSENEMFHIEDFIEIAEYIKDNFDKLSKSEIGLHIECPLRNLEVAIEECKVINKESFNLNGDIFAKYIDDAINM